MSRRPTIAFVVLLVAAVSGMQLGCCHGEIVSWCTNSQLDSQDCEDDGLECDYDPDIDALGCV